MAHKIRDIPVCMALMLIIVAIICLPASVTALQASTEGSLPELVLEGQVVDFNITLSGIPLVADKVLFDTDLLQHDEQPIISLDEQDIRSNDTPFTIQVQKENGILKLHIHGLIPQVTEVNQHGAVTLTTYKTKRTGYAYYRVRFTDDTGNPITESDTRIFSIKVDSIDNFRNKLNKIPDAFMSNYLQDLFDKGLVSEANRLADYEIAKETQVSGIYFVIGIILTAIVALVIGIRIGGRGIEEEEE